MKVLFQMLWMSALNILFSVNPESNTVILLQNSSQQKLSTRKEPLDDFDAVILIWSHILPAHSMFYVNSSPPEAHRFFLEILKSNTFE